MKSYWEKEHKEFEEIKQDKEAFVCVIGGGITGISTAYYLSKYKIACGSKPLSVRIKA